MPKFHFKADCTFEADELDEALIYLAAHFMATYMGRESALEQIGTLELKIINKTG